MIFGLLVPAAAAWGLLQWLRRVNVPVLLRRTVPVAAAALTLWAAVTQMRAQQMQTEVIRAELTWQPELGGFLGDQAEKLAAEKALLGGEAVFSTYAGGSRPSPGSSSPPAPTISSTRWATGSGWPIFWRSRTVISPMRPFPAPR